MVKTIILLSILVASCSTDHSKCNSEIRFAYKIADTLEKQFNELEGYTKRVIKISNDQNKKIDSLYQELRKCKKQ